ncbi:MAG: zf-TFIIB domain-containing protein [Candidatus Pacebacteria bacterium]|nr:zf-TFIIB domain-containing protein [Candidatus Paceibacterota bacterium]
MKCPRCGKSLDEIIVGNCRVDRCDKCGGIWFDKDELSTIRDERDGNLSWLDFDLWSDINKLKSGGTYLDCPRDGGPLYKIQYGSSDVMADVCLECHGVWLEKGEMEKIIKNLEQKINKETLPEYLRDLELEVHGLFLEAGHTKEELRNIAIIMKLIAYRLVAQYPKITKIVASLPD